MFCVAAVPWKTHSTHFILVFVSICFFVILCSDISIFFIVLPFRFCSVFLHFLASFSCVDIQASMKSWSILMMGTEGCWMVLDSHLRELIEKLPVRFVAICRDWKYAKPRDSYILQSWCVLNCFWYVLMSPLDTLWHKNHVEFHRTIFDDFFSTRHGSGHQHRLGWGAFANQSVGRHQNRSQISGGTGLTQVDSVGQRRAEKGEGRMHILSGTHTHKHLYTLYIIECNTISNSMKSYTVKYHDMKWYTKHWNTMYYSMIRYYAILHNIIWYNMPHYDLMMYSVNIWSYDMT